MTPMQDVAGKVAFITGGASGVGFGMAKVFLEAGMKVVIADIRQDHLDAAMGLLPGAHPIRLDVTDRAAMASAAAETERVFGKVHVVCNNAGINLFTDIGTATYSDWDWIMGVNFGGVVNGVQAFVPRIKAHGEGGHVINTASMASFIVGPGAGIYTTSKFAVRGLSEALRWSLAPHGIGVSVLCPGLVKSTIYESERIRPAHLAGSKMDPAFVARLEQVHKLGMEPEEVGRKVLRGMLAGDFYIFSHPEFKEELRAIFDAALASLPEETPPAERLAFEESRRAGYAAARRTWKTRDPLK
jgi:NAD(P)-dependent dehydrogenase (short-subunit alcohol dehydrogenase family)